MNKDINIRIFALFRKDARLWNKQKTIEVGSRLTHVHPKNIIIMECVCVCVCTCVVNSIGEHFLDLASSPSPKADDGGDPDYEPPLLIDESDSDDDCLVNLLSG